MSNAERRKGGGVPLVSSSISPSKLPLLRLLLRPGHAAFTLLLRGLNTAIRGGGGDDGAGVEAERAADVVGGFGAVATREIGRDEARSKSSSLSFLSRPSLKVTVEPPRRPKIASKTSNEDSVEEKRY